MLRLCIGNSHKDWISHLPAFEFTINSAQLDSTRFAPFFLNMGQVPQAMIWNAPALEEYPSI
ncbi:hypothetical protein BDN67DRAFT_914116 [Paxillus ammoniavirescens]|nr:hypothetical protein BDN67DRAFT_914116 [Paxillus ammoniavirescens]